MAKITQTFEAKQQKTVLHFMGREFTLTMLPAEYGWHSKERAIADQVDNTFADIPDEIFDLLSSEVPGSGMVDDLIEQLDEYEREAGFDG